ncbi:MAG: T9SS type A sorting domain-containing protein, partial [Marinirhabdus sp.]|nr:T9SS type A sorting domain-containing protein [Marinirhabdus sp.]
TTGKVLQQARLYDISGKLVQTVSIDNAEENTAINLSELASGVYLISVESDTNTTVKRIVKY